MPCKLDLSSIPFRNETIITYELKLPPGENKMGSNFMDEKTLPSHILFIPFTTHWKVTKLTHKLRRMCGLLL